MIAPVRWSIFGLCVASASAQAGETASIKLRGYVPEISKVSLHDVNPVVSHDLRGAVRDALLARVVEQSNSASGYTIKLISENGQRGRRAGLADLRSGAYVPYSLSYGGASLRFVNGQAEILRDRPSRRERVRENELRISTEGGEGIPTGEYTDTLTIAVTAR